jgi:hypothetical protein
MRRLVVALPLIALLTTGACNRTPVSTQANNAANAAGPVATANAAVANAAMPANAAIPANAVAPTNAAEPAEAGTSGRELIEGSANLDFIIVNRTGQTIVALSISPKGEESWTDNLVAQRDVPPDERAAASFSRDLEECLWDVRATYQGGARQSWPRINLCDTIRVELR